MSPRFHDHGRGLSEEKGVMTGHADAKSPVRKQSDLQGQDRRSCFGYVQLGNEGVKQRRFTDMVAREEVGLGDSEGNAVVLGVENDGYGGIRRPSEVSGEREEVEEGERERERVSEFRESGD
ncbi:hypothetical protein TIFTF001_047049 [Ficus carica]|uniref:Uncharacterized protein n=1 Tax=Ficus carica TaxID=3494 RepID=A0AA88CHJ2_FICCA|nr:hypothetical protein TIFTF001_047043 [Ficus carica]GMN20123.1 hypothetical protein TIFTF001_047044 [Ficus carica]GMN20147.1 hypothetical protein TIFTF001_047048 [Ficus carica]GMN20160.1 hypothetical protein TIFTF001_047049 [Ficus carica]